MESRKGTISWFCTAISDHCRSDALQCIAVFCGLFLTAAHVKQEMCFLFFYSHLHYLEIILKELEFHQIFNRS